MPVRSPRAALLRTPVPRPSQRTRTSAPPPISRARRPPLPSARPQASPPSSCTRRPPLHSACASRPPVPASTTSLGWRPRRLPNLTARESTRAGYGSPPSLSLAHTDSPPNGIDAHTPLPCGDGCASTFPSSEAARMASSPTQSLRTVSPTRVDCRRENPSTRNSMELVEKYGCYQDILSCSPCVPSGVSRLAVCTAASGSSI